MGPETIDEGTMGNIAFTVYRDDALFVMDGGQDDQVGSNEGRRNITVNTNIIGASLGTSETKPLNAPVTITLAHKQVKYQSLHELVCRFYLLNGRISSHLYKIVKPTETNIGYVFIIFIHAKYISWYIWAESVIFKRAKCAPPWHNLAVIILQMHKLGTSTWTKMFWLIDLYSYSMQD